MNTPMIVSHCGDNRFAPENTLSAFRSALAKGADGIEFDVHPTRDGELVVHHDCYLGRTDNGDGFIGDFTLAELRALDAGSWFGAQFASERMPTLSEVLELDLQHFEIDMKGSDLPFLERLLDEITRLGVAERVELTSNHTPLLFHARRLAAHLSVGMYFYPYSEWSKPALKQKHILDWMVLSDAQVAHLPVPLIDKQLIEHLHAHGYRVHGTNLSTEEDIAKGLAAGVDQFTTDSLDLAVSKVKGARP